MLKRIFVGLVITIGVPILLVSDSYSSEILSPGESEILGSYPVEITIQLHQGARPETLVARLNQEDITERFEKIDSIMRASVGPEDGLIISDDLELETNRLRIQVEGPGREKDIDFRRFFVFERYAPIKIGEIHPFTGALIEFGNSTYNAAQLAVKHLRKAGYTVETAVADSKTDPGDGVVAAWTLVFGEHVQVLIGAAASGVTIPIAEWVSIPSHTPQISYASTSPLISELPVDEGVDFLFRTCPSDSLQGAVLAEMAYDAGYKSVSVLYVDNPYGQGLNEVFKESFETLGGTVLASVPHDEQPAASYVNELQQATAGMPDALVAVSYASHAAVYLKEAIDKGLISTFLFVDGTKSEAIIEAVGGEALEGMCGTAPGVEETESLKIFNKTYKAEYHEAPPVSFMSNTYDAVILAALAAYEAQVAGEELTSEAIRDHLRSVSGPPGKKVLPGARGLIQALQLLRNGDAIDYVGASGDVNFDQNGDVLSPVEIWCYEGGEIISKRLVKP